VYSVSGTHDSFLTLLLSWWVSVWEFSHVCADIFETLVSCVKCGTFLGNMLKCVTDFIRSLFSENMAFQYLLQHQVITCVLFCE